MIYLDKPTISLLSMINGVLTQGIGKRKKERYWNLLPTLYSYEIILVTIGKNSSVFLTLLLSAF